MIASRRSFVAAIPALILMKGSPMANELVYQETRSAVLDGAGGATLTFNGPPSLTTRRLQSIVLSCSSSSPRPSAVVYRSSIAPGRRIGATRLADSDTLINDGEVLQSGEPLFVVVSGGLAGATMTVNAFGEDSRA